MLAAGLSDGMSYVATSRVGFDGKQDKKRSTLTPYTGQQKIEYFFSYPTCFSPYHHCSSKNTGRVAVAQLGPLLSAATRLAALVEDGSRGLHAKIGPCPVEKSGALPV